MVKKGATYQVIHDFKDLQDKNKIYRAGETYPTPANKKVSDKRLDELMSKNNRLGVAVIAEVGGTEEKK